jgi:hypothetical protein
LFELAEAALDQVTLGIEVAVERMLFGPRRVVRDDGDRAFVGDNLSEMVGIIGGISHDDFGRQPLDQRRGLRHIATMTGCQRKADGTAQASNCKMYLRAQATTRAPDGLIFRPPFLAPAAC